MIFTKIKKKKFRFKKTKEIYHNTAAHESHFIGRKSENIILEIKLNKKVTYLIDGMF
jgi:hypothetical protein